MTIPAIPMQLMVEAKDNKADLYINGDITKGFKIFGFDCGQETDVSYQDVTEALNDLPSDVSEINVHINSYGGEVAEGVAIYNALKSHDAHVTTVCEGFACSVASVIFMAGDSRVMRASSLLMLHNASMGAHGDANAHRKAADDLDVITELSKTAYLSHATESLTREKLTEVMNAETWVTPETALEWGLATEIDGGDDADEPTQCARNLVMRSLTNPLSRLHNASDVGGEVQAIDATTITTLEYPPRSETLKVATPDWAVQLFTRIEELEQLITAEPEPAPEIHYVDASAISAGTIAMEDANVLTLGGKRKYDERFAQIFKQLANR